MFANMPTVKDVSGITDLLVISATTRRGYCRESAVHPGLCPSPHLRPGPSRCLHRIQNRIWTRTPDSDPESDLDLHLDSHPDPNSEPDAVLQPELRSGLRTRILTKIQTQIRVIWPGLAPRLKSGPRLWSGLWPRSGLKSGPSLTPGLESGLGLRFRPVLISSLELRCMALSLQ